MSLAELYEQEQMGYWLFEVRQEELRRKFIKEMKELINK